MEKHEKCQDVEVQTRYISRGPALCMVRTMALNVWSPAKPASASPGNFLGMQTLKEPSQTPWIKNARLGPQKRVLTHLLSEPGNPRHGGECTWSWHAVRWGWKDVLGPGHVKLRMRARGLGCSSVSSGAPLSNFEQGNDMIRIALQKENPDSSWMLHWQKQCLGAGRKHLQAVIENPGERDHILQSKKMSIKVCVIFWEKTRGNMCSVWPCNRRSQITVLFH